MGGTAQAVGAQNFKNGISLYRSSLNSAGGDIALYGKSANQSGAYDAAYRRLFQFYAAGMANATDPFEVGAVIHHAVTTDQPQLRYPVSWGGTELIEGRAAMTDHEWVALGAHEDDDAYYDDFKAKFGLELRL